MRSVVSWRPFWLRFLPKIVSWLGRERKELEKKNHASEASIQELKARVDKLNVGIFTEHQVNFDKYVRQTTLLFNISRYRSDFDFMKDIPDEAGRRKEMSVDEGEDQAGDE